ncbi:MAG TPA: hypothetical protein VJV79_11555, partial [Polyangiaceae bacterium]|nr:hypothetical protein [Polyangiaceae bacterium]
LFGGASVRPLHVHQRAGYAGTMNTRSLGIALVFVAGCAVGGASARFVVPPANAQQAAALTKLEYYCAPFHEDKATELSNKMGEQGWDMASVSDYSTGNTNLFCFKRPKL